MPLAWRIGLSDATPRGGHGAGSCRCPWPLDARFRLLAMGEIDEATGGVGEVRRRAATAEARESRATLGGLAAD